MLPKPFGDIRRADIESLIDNVREGKTIEFKSEMPARTNEEKLKLLRAASSLANTTGGDLLIGIKAEQGLAIAIVGMDGATIDAEKLRLSQILASQLEPRLPATDIVGIDCGANGHVLILRVQRSWLAPHRIKIDNTFYGRNSAGNYPLDVGELRSAFMLSDSISDRVKKFRTDRLIQITAGQTPLRLISLSTWVIHVVPIATFANLKSIDIVSEVAKAHVMPLPPGRQNQSNNHLFNLDGIATFTNLPNELAHTYAQVFRSGAIEGVQTLSMDDITGKPFLPGPALEKSIVAAIQNYLLFFKSIDVTPPFFVFLSLCGVRGCVLRYSADIGSSYYAAGPLEHDTIPLPDVMIGADSPDVPAAMRPAFNALSNAFGLERSSQYDGAGKWTGG